MLRLKPVYIIYPPPTKGEIATIRSLISTLNTTGNRRHKRAANRVRIYDETTMVRTSGKVLNVHKYIEELRGYVSEIERKRNNSKHNWDRMYRKAKELSDLEERL